MKNKHVIFHFLYYVLTIVVYMAFFYASSLMLELTGKADNLGSVMAVTYGVLFVMTPVLVAIRILIFDYETRECIFSLSDRGRHDYALFGRDGVLCVLERKYMSIELTRTEVF